MWFALGLVVGATIVTWLADRRWRAVGDHPYMNRIESGGHLYIVKREDHTP